MVSVDGSKIEIDGTKICLLNLHQVDFLSTLTLYGSPKRTQTGCERVILYSVELVYMLPKTHKGCCRFTC